MNNPDAVAKIDKALEYVALNNQSSEETGVAIKSILEGSGITPNDWQGLAILDALADDEEEFGDAEHILHNISKDVAKEVRTLSGRLSTNMGSHSAEIED